MCYKKVSLTETALGGLKLVAVIEECTLSEALEELYHLWKTKNQGKIDKALSRVAK